MRLSLVQFAPLLLWPACSADAGGDVVGTYSCAFDLTGKPAELQEQMRQVELGDCIVNADGTFSTWMAAGGKRLEMQGDWTLDGNEFAMTATEENGRAPATPTTIHGVLNGTSITLTMEKGGQQERMILTRK